MKILHVIRSVDPRGGGPIEGIKLLGRIHIQAGREVEVASLDAPEDEWVRDCPLPTHGLGPVRSKYGYAPRLTRWLRENAPKYDAVIVNGLWQYSGFAVWNVLRHTPIPYYVFPHGMLDPWFKTAYPLKHLKKWLYWPWAEYRVLRDANAVFFTCQQERQLARQSFWLYRCREIVLGYGTAQPPEDNERQLQCFQQHLPECQSKRILLFLGRLHEKKGCDLLLRAFARVARSHPAFHLVMAGPDQTGWEENLRGIAEELSIADRVSWPGMLTGDLKWGAFRAADAFVLPSHQENFGLALAEGLACGVPVLISDKVNIWREIQSDRAGFVAPDTVEGTCQLLQNWLALRPEARAEMRNNARNCFTSRFAIENVAARLTNYLQKLGSDPGAEPDETGIARAA